MRNMLQKLSFHPGGVNLFLLPVQLQLPHETRVLKELGQERDHLPLPVLCRFQPVIQRAHVLNCLAVFLFQPCHFFKQCVLLSSQRVELRAQAGFSRRRTRLNAALFCWGGPAPDNPLQQMLAISQEIFVSKLPSVSMNLAETLSRSNKQSYNYQKNKTDSFFLKEKN